MKKKPTAQSAFFNRRLLLSLAFCSIGLVLALLAFALYPGGNALAQAQQPSQPAAQSLSPEEARKMAEGIRPLVNRSTDGLVQVQRPDGSVSMKLEGRFQNVTVAKREANGTVSKSCVDNADSAAAFFGISPQLIEPAKTAPVSPNQPAPKQSENR